MAGPFLESMSKIASTEEKASAFVGFNNLIQQNPKAMEGSMTEYFTAIAQFPYKTQDPDFAQVKESFSMVISGYHSLIPDFGSFLSGLPTNVQQKLKNAYSLWHDILTKQWDTKAYGSVKMRCNHPLL